MLLVRLIPAGGSALTASVKLVHVAVASRRLHCAPINALAWFRQFAAAAAPV
jgi:hypothetical protein